MRESFGESMETNWRLHESKESLLGKPGKVPLRKVRERWTNLKIPEEIECGFQHTIFKDLSAQPRKKAQKIVDQSQIAPLPAGGSAAVSNDDGAMELYPSDPEVSKSEGQADGSAGIISLNISGNQWREDEF